MKHVVSSGIAQPEGLHGSDRPGEGVTGNALPEGLGIDSQCPLPRGLGNDTVSVV